MAKAQSFDLITPSPFGDVVATCNQSLTYAAMMAAMGFNNGSKEVTGLCILYKDAKAVTQTNGRAPVSMSKISAFPYGLCICAHTPPFLSHWQCTIHEIRAAFSFIGSPRTWPGD